MDIFTSHFRPSSNQSAVQVSVFLLNEIQRFVERVLVGPVGLRWEDLTLPLVLFTLNRTLFHSTIWHPTSG